MFIVILLGVYMNSYMDNFLLCGIIQPSIKYCMQVIVIIHMYRHSKNVFINA